MVWLRQGVPGVGAMEGNLGGQGEDGVNRVRRIVEELGEAAQCKGGFVREMVKCGDIGVLGSDVYAMLCRCRVFWWLWHCGGV